MTETIMANTVAESGHDPILNVQVGDTRLDPEGNQLRRPVNPDDREVLALAGARGIVRGALLGGCGMEGGA